MRWILVDRFLEFDGARVARAIKNVSMGEDFGSAHYPGLPIFPGSLVLEALAQTGGILVARSERFEKKVILAKIERAVFGAHARPGDQLLLEAEVIERRDEGFKVSARAAIAGAGTGAPGPMVAEAVILFVNLGGHQQGAEMQDNFVFTPEFLGLFRGVDLPPADAQALGGVDR